MTVFRYVCLDHFGLAAVAAGLFLLGGLLAYPVARTHVSLLTRVPLLIFRMVLKLIGPSPTLTRLALVIFGFNANAIFLYMASGLLDPRVPGAIAFLTGFNIAAILLLSGEGEQALDLARPPGNVWVPGTGVTAGCGLAVLLLELPCFWYAIAMGIRLGQEVAGGTGAALEALSPRWHAYKTLIIPLLLTSAVCEAVAIRGLQERKSGSDALAQND